MREDSNGVRVKKQFGKDLALILLLLTLLVAGGIYSGYMGDGVRFKAIDVNIEYPNGIVLLTEDDIRQELLSDLFVDMFTLIDRVDVDSIESYLSKNSYIDSVEVYKSQGGSVQIDILQRSPILRVVEPTGEAFFYDVAGDILPINPKYPCRLPILTCDTLEALSVIKSDKYDKKIAENYNFLDNLLNFVMFIRGDAFWSRQIVQINLNRDGEVELVPRVGCHLIVLCDIEDMSAAESNLKKLEIFYKGAMDSDMWSTLKSVNLKYQDQVVCLR